MGSNKFGKWFYVVLSIPFFWYKKVDEQTLKATFEKKYKNVCFKLLGVNVVITMQGYNIYPKYGVRFFGENFHSEAIKQNKANLAKSELTHDYSYPITGNINGCYFEIIKLTSGYLSGSILTDSKRIGYIEIGHHLTIRDVYNALKLKQCQTT